MIHGADGRVLRSNPAARQLLGLAELDGRPADDRVWRFFREDGTEMPTAEYPIAWVLAQRQPLRNAVIGSMAPAAAKPSWMLVNALPLLEVDGRVAEVIVMFLDISDRKRIEEELREADRRKDQFMATLGHELRNPLAPIQNASYILRKLGSSDPRAARAQEMIEWQVWHVSRILDDLLDVSRIARGKVALQKEPVDLVSIVRMTVEDLRGEIETRGLELMLDLPTESVWVVGDPTRLSQCRCRQEPPAHVGAHGAHRADRT